MKDIYLGVKGNQIYLVKAKTPGEADDALSREPGEPRMDHLFNLARLKMETWEYGQVVHVVGRNITVPDEHRVCPSCSGAGRIMTGGGGTCQPDFDECAQCGGKGWVPR